MQDIKKLQEELLAKIEASDDPSRFIKGERVKDLFRQIALAPVEERAEFGKAANQLKKTIAKAIAKREEKLSEVELKPIDVTAPFDENSEKPNLLPAVQGTTHPLSQEIQSISSIFNRMGFNIEFSRELDDQYHMFESVNFPKNHPARDDYDTFLTTETDSDGEQLVAPAHTSTMQNRVLKKYKSNLKNDEPIAVVIPDRVFRNEDLDARHEHTFYQFEGVYVGRGVHAGMLIATLQSFLEEYYGKKIKVRMNPFYFPFTEPSFEFSLGCPFCDGAGCHVCSQSGWVELIGCGMIHPNVLKMAGIDSSRYTGFAWGCGIDRLVMMKDNIEDVRNFQSGKLDFLRQF